MFLTDLFAVVLFLIYFWYMTQFDSVPKVDQPTGNELLPGPLNARFFSHGPHYHVHADGKEWQTSIPQHHVLRDDKIVPQDACHGHKDGDHVLASGRTLYQFMQSDSLMTPSSLVPFEMDAASILQDKRVFYFSCQHGRVHQLHTCPPGHLFQQGSCQPINVCSGQPDGTILPNPYDATVYYECYKETVLEGKCPVGTRFIHDGCKNYQIGTHCQAHGAAPLILDRRTLLVCDGERVTFETCPPGFMYFDKPYCETEACMGQLDGTRLPLAPESDRSLSYSPGFMTCKNNRMDTVEACPKQWDPYLSPDQLSFLPQVFDGSACTAPILCTNVTPIDSNLVVPTYDFTKHVSEWPLATQFDHVVGTQCVGQTRQTIHLPPGQRIHAQSLKPESACDTPTARVVVGGTTFTKYYDCATQTVVECPRQHFFDGVECKKSDPHAHAHKSVNFFTMDNLSEHNWMKPWDYLKKELYVDACTDPSYVLNKQYNVCVHPECVLYPFLSQVAFKIGLKDAASECVYDSSKNQIDKQPTTSPHLYWSQRQVMDPHQDDPCTPGRTVQSGHFVMDSTLYATCDESQPFVFCPSSSTGGVNQLANHGWYCIPPSTGTVIPPNTRREFAKNELTHIYRFPENIISAVVLNGARHMIPATTGIDVTKIDKPIVLETRSQSVKVIFQYIVLYPPNIIYKYDAAQKKGFIEQAHEQGTTFLMKLASFTQKPLTLPKHEVVPSVSQFIS